MRLTISLLFTLLMASSALAQFKVTPNPEVNYGNGSFECGIVQLHIALGDPLQNLALGHALACQGILF
jgi:hypothetical protein